MKYQKQASLGLAGLALIASPLIIKLPPQFSAFNAANAIRASEDIERIKVAERAATADAINEAGVIPSSRKLRMLGYLDNSKHNPKPDVTGYLEDEIVFVYDSVGKCIGRIQERKWAWKYRIKDACNSSPPLKLKQE